MRKATQLRNPRSCGQQVFGQFTSIPAGAFPKLSELGAEFAELFAVNSTPKLTASYKRPRERDRGWATGIYLDERRRYECPDTSQFNVAWDHY
jgi:hypothetical protein